MLNVLLESKAARTRRSGGTFLSILVHGAIASGAVLLTAQPPLDASKPPERPPITWIDIDRPPAPPPAHRPTRTSTSRTITDGPPAPPLPTPGPVQPGIPPIDPGTVATLDDFGGLGPTISSGSETGGGHGFVSVDSVVDEHRVDRSPRMLRSETPRFPDALRQRGQNGRVVVQFVIDTLGRAELSGLKIVEASDPQFSDAVRSALPRFRFAPGEVRGQKVRTLVQLPFDFTLVR